MVQIGAGKARGETGDLPAARNMAPSYVQCVATANQLFGDPFH
jgi:hypothetical protein